jgi:hypothetical protein
MPSGEVARGEGETKFDWRRFEHNEDFVENEKRGEHWPEFLTHELMRRYLPEHLGYSAWRGLVANIREADEEWRCAAAFDAFLEATSNLTKPLTDCVFVSHQRRDTARGERIACLAEHYGVDHWLDVHDPTLKAINAKSSIQGVARSFLIAAAIEMGLLNSTHVITIHSRHSLASRWVPYELGRAKARSITSAQAAGWFESRPIERHGEYVFLVAETYTELEVETWLQRAGPGVPRTPTPRSIHPRCNQHSTSTLK